uniref:Nudix hydrolase domain-containing protein n=1 Tax=Eucampia antarctica TaxID=49252 RepID=A0A7S2S268_9STRA
MDNISKGVSDLLVVHPDGKKIFIGKRNVHPQPDWWLVGGRMFTGETAVDSCRRLLQRELTLDIHPNRFTTVCCQTMAWHMRQQEPKHHGTVDLQVVLSFQVKEDELSKVVFDRNEYDEVKWVDAHEILNGDYHPALKHPIRCLLTKWKLKKLEGIIDSDNNDDVAKAAKGFVQSMRECNSFLVQEQKDGQSNYKVKNEKMNYEANVFVKAPGIEDE